MKPNKIQNVPAATPAQIPVAEADFDDTIAQNRTIPIIDPASVPRSPPGFRLTGQDKRNQRLRKVAGELRAETVDALQEAGARDLKADLGKYAPSQTQLQRPIQRERKTAEARSASSPSTFRGRARDPQDLRRLSPHRSSVRLALHCHAAVTPPQRAWARGATLCRPARGALERSGR